MLISFIALLPRGAVTHGTLINFMKACFTAICTTFPLAALQPLSLWLTGPLFIMAFVATAMATRLVRRADLDRAIELVWSKTSVLRKSRA